MRRLSLRVTLALMIVGTGTLVSLGAPSAVAASTTVIEPASTCKRFDPNIGSGACLRVQSKSGVAYTWIGTYHATNGVSFYCIDYLYDSRIDASSARVSTAGLRNQLNRPIGAAEVAALNALISAHAPSGGAGSWAGNAAIALIIREVMSDGIRSDGTVVYPTGLKVGGAVRAMPGGAPSAILTVAQQWWREASTQRGGWTVRLTPGASGASVPLGTPATYHLRVLSAAGHDVPGVVVKLACSGPVSCPASVTTASTTKTFSVTPRALGDFVITATASGPSSQGQLLKGPWSPHGGASAIDNGVQRGWIAQRVPTKASAKGAAHVVKGTPRVITQAQPTAQSGEALTDLITISDLPSGSQQPISATLFGPFAQRPTATSCTPEKAVGTVTVSVAANGSVRTPPVTAVAPGYYVWTESLPGDALTNPVQTACGIAEETTLVTTPPVLDHPSLRTSVSTSRITVPGSVSDMIAIKGLTAGTITVDWTLLGPVAPGRHGCADLNWAGAPVRANGILSAGSGIAHTPSVQLSLAGCYTFTEHSLPTATAAGTVSAPGLPEETVLGTRPAMPIVPEVPTGPVGPALSGWWAFLRVA